METLPVSYPMLQILQEGKKNMAQRETRKRRRERIKAKIRLAILALIFAIILFTISGYIQEQKIALLEENQIIIERTSFTNTEETNLLQQEENANLTKHALDEAIEESYLGFSTIAKLEVPKINLDTYILKDYTQEGMKVCASKFWGPEPNEVGNFCIAGHNYQQENMFNHLIDLETGDELYLSDNKNGKYVYTIDKIYRVKPENTAPIMQETQGKRMVTLITCVNYSKNRLIVQAVEEEKE